jgi:5'-3' exonuclease
MDVLLLDAKNLLFRVGWTFQDLTTDTGERTGAVYGLLEFLLRLKRQFSQSRFIAVWDGANSRNGGWRHQFCSTYKDNRNKPPADPKTALYIANVLVQVPLMKQVFTHLQTPQVEVDGVEADDMIGILVASLQGNDGKVIVFSSDKDFYQLAKLGALVINRAGDNLNMHKTVMEKFGCSVGQLTGLRALLGDTSDNIPRAVDGVGPVKALKLIQAGANPSKKSFADHSEEVQREIKLLESHWDTVHQNWILTKIVTSLDSPRLTSAQQTAAKKSVARALSTIKMKMNQDATLYREFIDFLGALQLKEAMERRKELWNVQA